MTDRPTVFFDKRRDIRWIDWDQWEKEAREWVPKSGALDQRDNRDPEELMKSVISLRKKWPEKSLSEVLDILEGIRKA